MTQNGNLASYGPATIYGSPWTGKPYIRSFNLQGNLDTGYTPALYDLLYRTSAGKFKKFDGDDILISEESVTLVASTKQLANNNDINVVKVTDSPETQTYVYGTDYTFTEDGVITALGGGSIGATDTILVTYTHTPAGAGVQGLLEEYDGTTYENNVLVELTEGEVDLEKVNTDNATSTYVIDYLIAKLKLMNINVL